ncbi:MAG: hypothetical protein FD180_3580, partial [Planctomycetota bacterium]
MRTVPAAPRWLTVVLSAIAALAVRAEEDPGWDLVRILARLRTAGPLEREDGVQAAVRACSAETAEAARDLVAGRVNLVPYEGSFVEPRDVRAGASLNTLDRARFLAAVLAGMKMEARVVTAQGAKVAYPAKNLESTVCVPEPIRESIRTSVKDTLPPLWEEVRRNQPDWAAGAGAAQEKEVAWVQVKSGAAWRDLAFADTTLAGEAKPVSPEAVARQAWTVTLTCTLHRGATSEEAFTWSSPAAKLHAVAVTYVHRPETFETFVPLLFVGSEMVEGKPFAATTPKGAVDRVTLTVGLEGPGESRTFERQVVSFGAGAEAFDRGLGLAFVARLTVVTTRLDDLDRAALTESVFYAVANAMVAPAHAAKLEKAAAGPLLKDSPALNLVSLHALAMAEASHELADLATEAMPGVRALRVRPTLLLEQDAVRLEGDKLRRSESTDLLEPGTGVSGPKEACARAAVAHSIAWARIEDAVTLGPGVETSWEAVARQVAAKSKFGKDAPAAALAVDLADGRAQAFVTTKDGVAGLVGLRLSSGPTAVWILSDGSGGSRTKREPMDRVRDLCGKLQWASYLAPLHVMPYSWLISPIVAYHCKLAEAYDKAAGALDRAFGGGGGGGDDAKRKELEDLLKSLGPGLVAELAWSAVLNGIAHGVVAPVVSEIGNSVVSPLLGWANRAGAGLIPRVASGAARAATEAD